MSMIVIPNVSEGRRAGVLASLAAAIAPPARILDVHTDAVHNRTVFTVAGPTEALIEAMTALAVEAAASIDLTVQTGTHPRLGALDVCPFVPHEGSMEEAIAAAVETAKRIGEAGLPVYLYEAAARRPQARSLPELRRGGLEGAIARTGDIPPDFGPSSISPRSGVVCVGARNPLIAFNVWLRCGVAAAREIAAKVRTSTGGLPGVRALGLEVDDTTSQVSMNLVEPAVTGIDAAFEAVGAIARANGIEVTGTEIVGLPPDAYMPAPDAEAARLLISPGRSLGSVLTDD